MKFELKDGRAVAALVGALVAGLLIGAAIGWAVYSSRVGDLEERLAAAETRLAEIAQAQEDASGATAEPDTASETPTAEEPDEAETPPTSSTEQQPAMVTSTRTAGGTQYLTLDYIQFLTGDEAANAAAERGDESPPPNDFYIVNDNPRLREFPIQPGITVRVVAEDGGTVNPEGYDLSLDDWLAQITGPEADAYLASFYWVTITDGTITAIEQQYLP